MIKFIIYLVTYFMSFFMINQNNKINQENKIEHDNTIDQSKIEVLFKDIKKTDPGVSLAILKNQKLVFQKNYGLANLEYNIPITENTVFHTASVSKQFTVYAILLLMEEGKLSLNDDIKKFIPELKIKEKITLKNLANHTSGLRDQYNLARIAGYHSNDNITNQQVLDIIYNQTELNFKPNSKYMYSNSGYTLLAEVVKRVSKMSFVKFTKTRIFDPLKMNNSNFIDSKDLIIKNKAYSYYKENNTFIKDVFNNESVGATNLSTTLNDLIKWSNFFTKNITNVDALAINSMIKLESLKNGKTYGYGLGLFVNNFKGVYRIEHSGLDASFQAYIGWFPKKNTSFIYLSNNGNINGGRKVNEITNIILKDHINGNLRKAKKLTKSNNQVKLSNQTLTSYQGFYWNSKDRFSRELRIVDGALHYVGSKGKLTKLIATKNNTFEFDTKEYTGVKVNSKSMEVILDDGYTLHFNKYRKSNHTLKSIKQYKGVYFSKELNTYYTITTKNTKLIAIHQRTGEFKLKTISNDFYIGNKGSFRNVYFTRDSRNQINGLKVSSSRAKNLFFSKVSI